LADKLITQNILQACWRVGVQVAWYGDLVTWFGGGIAAYRHNMMSKVSCLTGDLFALVSYKAVVFSLHTPLFFYHKVIFSSTALLPIQIRK